MNITIFTGKYPPKKLWDFPSHRFLLLKTGVNIQTPLVLPKKLLGVILGGKGGYGMGMGMMGGGTYGIRQTAATVVVV